MRILSSITMLIRLSSLDAGEVIKINIDESFIENASMTYFNGARILIAIGITLAIISGVIFAFLMQKKLQAWESSGITPIPLGNFKTRLSWLGGFTGVSILSTGALEILDFSPYKSLIFSIIFGGISGTLMWGVVKELLSQVASGTVKEIDEYF
tara:strand:+ start:126 stop:587 length:462 start_codon:yes stop_codon:yes gene_type:complete